jgi:hypothetical protein
LLGHPGNILLNGLVASLRALQSAFLEDHMGVVRRKTITSKRVLLDGNEYLNCLFIDCELIYRGGACTFQSNTRRCSWLFEGPAMNTIGILRELGVLGNEPSDFENVTRPIRANDVN